MKRIILTGGSDGLGEAFGRLCRQKGIEVVCLSRSKPSYDAVHIKTDLRDPASIEAAAKIVLASHSVFDALVNCAGIIAAHKPNAIPYDELAAMFQVNALAPIYLASLLFDGIRGNGADVMNVSSTAGLKGNPEQGGYGASKWALRGTSQNLQVELKGTPCRVIQFNPGGMKSKLFEKGKVSADTSKFVNPADIAGLMLSILELPKSVEVSEITVNRK